MRYLSISSVLSTADGQQALAPKKLQKFRCRKLSHEMLWIETAENNTNTIST